MQIEPKQIFEVIKEGPDMYVQSLPYLGKTIEQAKRMLPPGYNIQLQSRKGDYADLQLQLQEHPDDEQYAVFDNEHPDHQMIHLYVNDGVIDDILYNNLRSMDEPD